jgi:hypothetical protein
MHKILQYNINKKDLTLILKISICKKINKQIKTSIIKSLVSITLYILFILFYFFYFKKQKPCFNVV